MADRNEKGHFVKGHNLATGRPRESIGRKNMKKIMNDEIDRIAKMTFGITIAELKQELKNKDQLTAAAQLLLSQIQKGNLKALELLMDRVLGRPQQGVAAELGKDNTLVLKYKIEEDKEDKE